MKGQKKNKDPCEGCVWRIWTGDEKGLCFFPDCRRKEYDRLWGSKKAKAAGNTAGDNGNPRRAGFEAAQLTDYI